MKDIDTGILLLNDKVDVHKGKLQQVAAEIRADLYHKTGKAVTNFTSQLPSEEQIRKRIEQAEEEFRMDKKK